MTEVNRYTTLYIHVGIFLILGGVLVASGEDFYYDYLNSNDRHFNFSLEFFWIYLNLKLQTEIWHFYKLGKVLPLLEQPWEQHCVIFLENSGLLSLFFYIKLLK